MKRKAETKKEANKIMKALILEGKTGISIFKFAGKRKMKFFIGNWWGLVSAN